MVSIDRETGEVLLVTRLDYETQKTYQLSVTASDRAIPQLTARVQLLIQVLDYNDNAPVFQGASLKGKQSVEPVCIQ